MASFIADDDVVVFSKSKTFDEVFEERSFNNDTVIGDIGGRDKEDWHEQSVRAVL